MGGTSGVTGDCRASFCGNRGELGLWESGQHTMMSYADDVRLYPPADYREQSPADKGNRHHHFARLSGHGRSKLLADQAGRGVIAGARLVCAAPRSSVWG
jgi:hypothetical protein